MIILDTDHLSILESRRGIEFHNLFKRLVTCDRSKTYITIVTFHEQITGWNRFLSRATSSDGVIKGYRQLELLLNRFANANLLPFSAPAAEVFDELRASKVRVATMDLRIASIAIANQMTLLTRNTVDFQRVPGLAFEDWTTNEV